MDVSKIAPGTVVGGRFETLAPAARGGMGLVYQARDHVTGDVIALKILVDDVPVFSEERFAREIELLSELRHPGIVRYVAHGRLRGGDPFLAMEWLDGVKLSTRLARRRLTLAECAKVLQQCAAALAEAHRLGIIHRDLKPENIFLRDDSIDRIVVLDFGIARRAYGDGALTIEGMVVGTPEYMSPEQARGNVNIGPSADIFSLGCVLFECVTGKSPFPAQHLAAVLAKIVFAACPKVSELRKGVPPDLVNLIDQMLSKRPEERPCDAIALLEACARLEPITPDDEIDDGSAAPSAGAARMEEEQRLISVILGSPTTPTIGAPARAAPPGPAKSGSREHAALLANLDSFGARAEILADGSLVATISRLNSSAVDLVGVAARCALTVRERWAGDHVVLATGRGVLQHSRPAVGEAIERAAGLLRARIDAKGGEPRGPMGVWLDESSSGLLSGRFVKANVAGGILLTGERTTVDEGRLLLGRPSPCVGRDLEIGSIEALFASSIEGSVARGVLLTADAGMGKSRVTHEASMRLRARFPGLKVLVGRGNPLGAGSPYAILGQALRRRFGLRAGASAEERSALMESALPPRATASDVRRLRAALDELCGVPLQSEAAGQLRAAGLEPKVLSDEIRRGVLDWLRYECSEAPLLLILDDLQWGDPLTIKLVAEAMRELSGAPFLVLGVARPEITALLPGPWTWLTEEMKLRPLSRRACEQLVREVAGDAITEASIARICEQSEGNALFLEELIRAEVEGRRGAAPETLIMMLQARLLRLEQGARRVLRAASVFGEVFWSGGARELADVTARGMEAWLEALVRDEIVERVKGSRFPGESEYRFRHALMREAVYRLLVDEDREAGHAFVSRYLERVGELDPMVIAEHAARGGDKERALRFYLRAAVISWERSEPHGILDRVERAVACGAAGEDLGLARAVACYGHMGKFEVAEAAQAGLSAIELLPPGSLWWCRAIDRLFFILPHAGQHDRMAELSELFLKTLPNTDAAAAHASAAASTATMLALLGDRRAATRFFDHLQDPRIRAIIDGDRTARRRVRANFAWYVRALLPEPHRALKLAREDDADSAELGVAHHIALSKLLLGVSEVDLGDVDRGEATLRRSLAIAATTRDPFLIVNAWTFLGLALAERREPERLDEAVSFGESVLKANDSLFLQGMANTAIAAALVAKGEAAEAEVLALRGAQLLASCPPYALCNAVVLIDARLALGRSAEASAAADGARRALDSLGGAGFSEIPILEAFARAKLAVGDVEAARRVIREAIARLELRAGAIPEPKARERFLRGRPENVRLVALAAEHLR